MTTSASRPSRVLRPTTACRTTSRRRAAHAESARRRPRRGPRSPAARPRPTARRARARSRPSRWIHVLGQVNTGHPPTRADDGAMDVAGHHQPHVRERGDELAERRRGRPRAGRSRPWPGCRRQRQMVHGHDRRASRGPRPAAPRATPAARQPRRPSSRPGSVVSTADEPQRAAARHVAVVLAVGDRERQREALAQRRAIVMVAGEHVDRHRQRREQLADPLVLARAARAR